MFALWQKDGVPIQELSKKTQLGKSTLTSMLDRLERMGYIQRKRSANDRRKVLITRTDKDRSLEKLYVQVSEQLTEIWYEGFSEKQIARFERDLQRILDNLMDVENR